MSLLVKAAINFLLSHKGRNAFLILGISLGVALIVIVQILLGSLQESNETTISDIHGDYDLVVGYQDGHKSLTNKELNTITDMEEVETVTPFLYPYLNKEEEYDMWGEPIYVGFNNDELAYEYPFVSIAEGHFPKAGEVVVSPTYATLKNLQIGSVIEMNFPPYGKEKVVVSGFSEGDEGLSNMVIFDFHWLQEATLNVGKTTALIVKLDDIKKKADVVQQLKKLNQDFFIDQRLEVDNQRNNIGGLGPFVQGLNIAIYLVSALILISTMRMSIQEKQKDLATLRLLGFGRKHIMFLVLIETLILGLVSLIVGIILGISIPFFTLDLFLGLMNVPNAGIVLPYQDILLSLGIFTIVIFLSSLIPGYMASLSSPIIIYRGVKSTQDITKRYIIISSLYVVLITIIFACNQWYWQSRIMYVINAVLFIVLSFITIPLMFVLFEKVISYLDRKVKVRAEILLATKNLLRQLGRNVQISVIFTLGIIITIIGMVVLTTVKEYTTNTIMSTYPNDLKVVSIKSQVEEGFPFSFYELVNETPNIEAFFYTNEKVFETINLPLKQGVQDEILISISGINLQYSLDRNEVKVKDEISLEEDLSPNGVMITEDTSKKLGYQLGDVIEGENFGNIDGDDKRDFIVEGIITNSKHISDEYKIFTSKKIMGDMFDVNTLYSVEMNIESETDQAETIEEIQSLIQEPQYTNTILYNRAEELNELEEQFLQRFFILYLAVGLIIIFTIIGLMNSTASSIKERIQELSMLRVLGYTKGRLFSLLVLEGALLTGSVGVLSVILSTLSAYNLLLGMNAETIIITPNLLLGLIISSPIVGVIAVLFPAIWVIKRNVLEGIR
ncbi:FtsX-like permease family protein [Lysinibacillus pakistanensis]|uniref:ABC transporter permease n=1 Tax=Lysinibacillus pakistanensis TaxID=759811 RepID=A0AAX3WS75_9BACI|nr:FtsX-like permease family protein [Lysinibacillus pakistanensis]MDM5230065.1 ABC transporter permease [Lysinibacillus pakistanensis]WHY45663.1 ABC transporter permease [Lysinibacillus pakistanensis]WHY50671.1 ABC transporter permease [Lysinibacillus pakistanensis]